MVKVCCGRTWTAALKRPLVEDVFNTVLFLFLFFLNRLSKVVLKEKTHIFHQNLRVEMITVKQQPITPFNFSPAEANFQLDIEVLSYAMVSPNRQSIALLWNVFIA